jgi:hypothetical protein
MSSESNLPARCQDCARSLGAIMHRECNICQEMEFNEGILCDLNRVVQDQSNFTCHAFRPILTLAGSSVFWDGDVSDKLDLLFRSYCSCTGNNRHRNSELSCYFCQRDFFNFVVGKE